MNLSADFAEFVFVRESDFVVHACASLTLKIDGRFPIPRFFVKFLVVAGSVKDALQCLQVYIFERECLYMLGDPQTGQHVTILS